MDWSNQVRVSIDRGVGKAWALDLSDNGRGGWTIIAISPSSGSAKVLASGIDDVAEARAMAVGLALLCGYSFSEGS